MKIEIDLTQDQMNKVEELKEHGIDIGEAIDILFDMKESLFETNKQIIENRISKANKEKAELEEKIAKIDEELSFFDKLKDTSLDSSQKQKIVENEYGKIDKTFDEILHDAKINFKWKKLFFKL